MGWNVASRGTIGNAYNVLVGRSQVKIPIGGYRRRRENNIKMDFKEML
jgi:hypothetical protein